LWETYTSETHFIAKKIETSDALLGVANVFELGEAEAVHC
jgi:hypothetical protein